MGVEADVGLAGDDGNALKAGQGDGQRDANVRADPQETLDTSKILR